MYERVQLGLGRADGLRKDLRRTENMMCDNTLSIDQISAVLDNAPLAIYVSAVDSRELLYVNQVAKDIFLHKSDAAGITCYQAAGFDRPCPFCQADNMNGAQFMVREFYNPADGRTYRLSGKLIGWKGRKAHIEYIQDITTQKQKENQARDLKEQLQAMFSSIPSGLCVYQYENGCVIPIFQNPAFYDIMGYSAEQIRGLEKDVDSLKIHPEDLTCFIETVKTAVQYNRVVHLTYRVFNDHAQEYRWIHMDGSVKTQPNGKKLLYGVFIDVNEQMRLEKKLADANEKMKDIVNAIPGGIAIYKISNVFKTVYFSDGVPELTGYSVEEYRGLIQRGADEISYWEDAAIVMGKAKEVLRTHQTTDFEFRKQHRDGRVVWVRARAKWIGEEDGCPLLHCVFHNISALKEAQLELNHVVNSIPGGIASYRVEADCFVPTFFSDGVPALTGHSREEYAKLVERNAVETVYEPDRERVYAIALAALASGEALDISFRMRHKNGELVWLHLNGRRIGPLSKVSRFYAVFTGMSEEAKLYQSIANETVDGIYVVDKNSYDLLYTNESKKLFMPEPGCVGQKCYMALHGNTSPCDFCPLKIEKVDGAEHEAILERFGRFFCTRFRETNWNGIPAYIHLVRDVTDEVKTRQEKKRLEQYFQTVIKNLPGGVAVVRYKKDGSMIPEYLSDGFAEMIGMTLEEAWHLYQDDAMCGVHPDDHKHVSEQMKQYIASDENHCEIIYRLKAGQGGYIWVKNTLSTLRSEGGERRVYAVYHDMTKERERQEQLRRQYNELILQHYRMPGPNALIVGHCNISQNRILEIIDHTGSNLLDTFGSEREAFFTGLSGLVVEEQERSTFLETYLNGPALAAFEREDTEQVLDCFVKLPRETLGRYVEFKVNLVSAPDTGDITGILTVTDITEQTISNRIMHQLSVSNYDFIIDLNLEEDSYTILKSNQTAGSMPRRGSHSQWVAGVSQAIVVPKDKARYVKALTPGEMLRRLKTEGAYTFAYSLVDAEGDIRTKNVTVSATDLRLGRVCLVRTDITDSVREQQGLLNVIAYTFELMGLIDIQTGRLTLYTRQTVLKNLSPYISDDYNEAAERFAGQPGTGEDSDAVYKHFRMETMLRRLSEKPTGYDFVFPYQSGDGLRYKQVNVLWGDENHTTLCMVRADVTDMLAAERQAKSALERALALAEEANRAKSEFLSAMSHDIRTPMNGIMGMTTLAQAHLADPVWVADCLEKISVSSKHLLSLINDVLDMSKIERAQIKLNRVKLSLPELAAQISAIMEPQAKAAGLRFEVGFEGIRHKQFYGDGLRINQILINLLSNAVKFTSEGGYVKFLVRELLPSSSGKQVRYLFTVSDTGCGMPAEFLAHVFEPFTRSRNAARIEGTGLGLSITKGLIDLMEGKISVDSRAEGGSIFQVELGFEAVPADEGSQIEETDAEVPIMEKEKTFAGRRFLVAEDNAINSEILCELMALYGAGCVVKTDGVQAVEAFRDAEPGRYDAILMDIQMPGMNGYEATRAIRQMERDDAGTIPIIAMTANAFAEDVQAAQEAGMTAHVAKPIDLDVLRSTLTKALRAANKGGV